LRGINHIRIYKDKNSLFNFNPSKDKAIKAAIKASLKTPEGTEFVIRKAKFAQELHDRTTLRYGLFHGVYGNHVHVIVDINGDDCLTTNWTRFDSKYKIYKFLDEKNLDTDFSSLPFIPKTFPLGQTWRTMATPLSVIGKDRFKEAVNTPLWFQRLDVESNKLLTCYSIGDQIWHRSRFIVYNNALGLESPLSKEDLVSKLEENKFRTIGKFIKSGWEFESVSNELMGELIGIPPKQVLFNREANELRLALLIKELNPQVYSMLDDDVRSAWDSILDDNNLV
jgi:hypothetical protein